MRDGLNTLASIVTDGEPTAHLQRDGRSWFDWPPSPETIELTLAEVDKMTRRHAALNIFMLADDARLSAAKLLQFPTVIGGVVDGAGNKVHYVLDNVGNRTSEQISDASGVLASAIARAYDDLNRLKVVTGAAQ